MHQPQILLVEDDLADVELARVVLDEPRSACALHHARDGQEALSFLHRRPPYEAAPTPDLVLLDLALPRIGGVELLQEIKSSAQLQHIPVVVLSGSDDANAVGKAHAVHANDCLRKAPDLRGYSEALRAVVDYWLGPWRHPTD